MLVNTESESRPELTSREETVSEELSADILSSVVWYGSVVHSCEIINCLVKHVTVNAALLL